MNTKALLATLVGGIASFLLGWLIFGTLMMSYFQAHMVSYTGMVKEPPNFIVLFVANLVFAWLIVMVMDWSNARSPMRGAIIGGWIGGLTVLGFDLLFYALYNYYTDFMIIIVDVVLNIIFYAIIGAVIGWMLGMGKKGEPAT